MTVGVLSRAVRGATGGGGVSNVPDPKRPGQIVYSDDGVTWEQRLPIVSHHGWLVNNRGILLVRGA